MLTIERCDLLERADDIKALFVRNARPTFPRFFDQAYPSAVAAGGASWVALNGGGAVVMHVAFFPRVFRDRHGAVAGGFLGDLMVDPSHRNFWAPLQLMRRAIADIRARGGVDFLYSDPTPPSHALLRAVGFVPFGVLRRYVLPLHWVYLALSRLRTRAQRLEAERLVDLDDPRAVDALAALQPGETLRAERSLASYRARVGGDVIAAADWWSVAQPGERRSVGLALLSPQAERRLVTLVDVLWDERFVSGASVLHAVAGAARRAGFARLSLTMLEETQFTRAAAAAGFLARPDTQPVEVLTLRETDPLPARSKWFMTQLDGSGW